MSIENIKAKYNRTVASNDQIELKVDLEELRTEAKTKLSAIEKLAKQQAEKPGDVWVKNSLAYEKKRLAETKRQVRIVQSMLDDIKKIIASAEEKLVVKE